MGMSQAWGGVGGWQESDMYVGRRKGGMGEIRPGWGAGRVRGEDVGAQAPAVVVRVPRNPGHECALRWR
ncbi:hypothetical protein GCM10011579_024210 [Streptomyces albiflavescens]|uniref:Uncharacterized protein n=1 Tax=Streptomyces albiflavescens TaxID=1623582 RepID=A0A917XZN2_9ACTN|nr:hypothetical protein GCM10011579_024210 [Streptomyces albiflavescens]